LKFPEWNKKRNSTAQGKNKMFALNPNWRCLILACLLVSACGGGDSSPPAKSSATNTPSSGTSDPPGSGTGGIEGTGVGRSIVSNGVITGLGSIIVEGVEYALDTSGIEGTGLNTTITVDGQPGTAADLVVGEVVTLTATAGSDTAHASATAVTFNTDIAGPVDALTPEGIIVLGQQVNLDPRAPWQVGDNVAISGFRRASGAWSARRVVAAVVPPYIVTGLIGVTDTQAQTFTINGLTVSYAGAVLTGLATGPNTGLPVRVKGRVRTAAGVLEADSVIAIDPALPGQTGDSALIEGWVTQFGSWQDFAVNGHHVTTTASTSFDPVGQLTKDSFADLFVSVWGTRAADGGVSALGVTLCNVPAVGIARSGHTALLMPDGKVMLVGGDPCGELPEFFDPATQTFSPGGHMAVARYGETATLLHDGRVLIAGGFGMGTPPQIIPGPGPGLATAPAAVLSAAEVYDPSEDAFTVTGSMSHPHKGHTATLLADGRVLIAGGIDHGGWGHASADAELFNPPTGTFSTAPPMSSGRAGNSATLLSSGEVLLVGGYCCHVLDDWSSWPLLADLFELASGTFITTGPMSRPRFNPVAIRVAGDDVLVIGGDAHDPNPVYAERFHSATRSFTPLSVNLAPLSVNLPQSGFTATTLNNGKIVLLGGATDAGQPVASSEILDPTTGQIISSTPLTTPRVGHSATLLSDGRVLVIGGTDVNGNRLSSFEFWSESP
jgi:hypothetical protein